MIELRFLLQQKRRDAKEISVEVKKQTVENHSENRTPPPNLTDPQPIATFDYCQKRHI